MVVGRWWRTIGAQDRVDDQSLTSRGDEPAQRAERRVPPAVLVRRDDGLRRARPPGELGLGEAPTAPHRPDQVVRFHAREYIASSMSLLT